MGDCAELTLNFLFSGVLIGEIFLLNPVITVILSLSLDSIFDSKSVLEYNSNFDDFDKGLVFFDLILLSLSGDASSVFLIQFGVAGDFSGVIFM